MLLPLSAEGMIMLMGDGGRSAVALFLQSFLRHEYDQAVINISLGVVVGALAPSVILSLLLPPVAAEEK